MFQITRDAEGRPEAVRLRLGGWGLRDRIRAFSGSVLGGASPVGRVLRPMRVISRGVLTSVPHIAYRRDDSGRVNAIVLRFGVGVAPVDGAAGAGFGERWSQLRVSWQSFLSRAVASLPRPVLVRDAWGQVTAVRLAAGPQPDAIAVPAVPEGRGPKWVIEPARAGFLAQAREFWRHRKTLSYFSRRAMLRMYRGTRLGSFWLVGRPLLPIIITTVVVGRLLGVPSDGVPYFLFFLAGTTSWALFERSVQWATRSLDQHKSVIKKVYFPRIIVPIASVAPAIMDALSYTGLLLAACVYYLLHDGHWYFQLGPRLLLAVFAAAMSVLLAIGVGLWTAVWQARAREIRYTLGYIMRFWNYLTPVMYPLSEVPPKYRWVMYLNPMAPIVETFKWGVLGIGELNVRALGSGVVVVLLMLASGIWYFNRSEGLAVDRM